ncbi:uncharacterized protein SETTUDRAFT_30390 [Exserohilum turcica Et28A]|uniref:Uncharacterized protein n=1 Tax=Exserohilum turcicum (strain 28A) TaxID=671987 RepID=R0KGA4_EXST2|nr:uncharacterized protein SETTUDRAFT_30390 [Exserohilum turcica Et28A]EOA91888.1 hypothetical protein SETTUDRAFT_30390 [Exserohilum turcica Et28A]
MSSSPASLTTNTIECRLANILSNGPVTLSSIADLMYPLSIGNEDAIATAFERIAVPMSNAGEEEQVYTLHAGYAHLASLHCSVDAESTEEGGEKEGEEGEEDAIAVEEAVHTSPTARSPVSSSSLSPPPDTLASPHDIAMPIQTPVPAPYSVSRIPSTSPLSSLPSHLSSPLSVKKNNARKKPPQPLSLSPRPSTSPLSSPPSNLSALAPTPLEIHIPHAATTTTATTASLLSSSSLSSPPSSLHSPTPTPSPTLAPSPPPPPQRRANKPGKTTASASGPGGPARNAKTKAASKKSQSHQVQCSGVTKKKTRCGFKKTMIAGAAWDCGRHD